MLLTTNTDPSSSSSSTPTSSASSFDTKTTLKHHHHHQPASPYEVSLAQAELDDDDMTQYTNFDFVDNVDEDLDTDQSFSEATKSVDLGPNRLTIKVTSASPSTPSTPSVLLTPTSSRACPSASLRSIFASSKEDSFGALTKKLKTNTNTFKTSMSKLPANLAPEEKLSNEAKEYWATIDFYNNSKLAFNKRCKSVKLKREKLNVEIKQRQMNKINCHLVNNGTKKVSFPFKKDKNAEEDELIDKELKIEQENQIKQKELCTCVKCSILYHEALIRGITNVNEIVCTKCNSKLVGCKCCSSHPADKSANRLSSGSANNLDMVVQTKSQETPASTKPLVVKDGLNQFEEKLFNIKNELVNLSETSLDVFQLLLQLSDTMLDLNNQISSSTNANQLFMLNSNLNINQNFILNTSSNQYLYDSVSGGLGLDLDLDLDLDHDLANQSDKSQCLSTNETTIIAQQKSSTTTTTTSSTKSNLIEDFLQKTFYSTQSNYSTSPNPQTQTQGSNTNKQLNNSISNIINSINNRSTSQKSKNQLEHVKRSHHSASNTLSSNCLSPLTNKLASSSTSSMKKALANSHQNKSKLIENVYDKTSVTQFVDSLLNMKSEKDDLSRSSSGFYSASSLLQTANANDEEDPLAMNTLSYIDSLSHQSYQSSSLPKQQQKLSTTTSTTSQILARQAQSSLVTNTKTGLKSTPIKSSTSSSSSSSSGSSGCGGSSSLCSSSNTDLVSLPSTSSYITVDDTHVMNKLSENRRSLTSTKSSSGESNDSQSYRHSTVSTASSTNDSTQFIQSPKILRANCAPTNANGSVAGIAASFFSNQNQNQNQRSNSVNFSRLGSSPVNSAASVNNAASSARKPSFKFENNTILNRVQNMNLSNKAKFFPNSAQQKGCLNEIGEDGERSGNVNMMSEASKRSSLNREGYYANEAGSKVVKRQQSVVNKPAHMMTPLVASTVVIQNSKIGEIRSNHQISLDSGIFLPSENEEAVQVVV